MCLPVSRLFPDEPTVGGLEFIDQRPLLLAVQVLASGMDVFAHNVETVGDLRSGSSSEQWDHRVFFWGSKDWQTNRCTFIAEVFNVFFPKFAFYRRADVRMPPSTAGWASPIHSARPPCWLRAVTESPPPCQRGLRFWKMQLVLTKDIERCNLLALCILVWSSEKSVVRRDQTPVWCSPTKKISLRTIQTYQHIQTIPTG